MAGLPRVLLVQLPIPPPGLGPIRGNVPLAAGYLTMLAREAGLDRRYRIEIYPARRANVRSDQGLVEDILAGDPWMVGFTCYLWNIERTLWVAGRIKAQRPEVRIVLGGPEISADNAWVLGDPSVDFACIGEGEQTFVELLEALAKGDVVRPIDGLAAGRSNAAGGSLLGLQQTVPAFRRPMAELDRISSPYLAGILDAADEQMMLLETVRGCVFKCKFCYYPKAYDSLYYVSREKIAANLAYARRRGAEEVVLLDPTLNQRKDFAEFLKLLAQANPDGQFTYFGELRGEGITAETARLLKEANFTEVEIGLQSVDPAAQELMDRKNNLRAFERGARAMRDAGLEVKVDLIIGLPGDTADSVRRGLDYLLKSDLARSVQVFQLAILPGTAFRQEAEALSLEFQPRPPYYVLSTPHLDLAAMVDLMQEAREALGIDWDSLPEPTVNVPPFDGLHHGWLVDLDRHEKPELPSPQMRAQGFVLRLRSARFDERCRRGAGFIRQVLADNPSTTLEIVVDPAGFPQRLTAGALETLRAASFESCSYLDRYYGLTPGTARSSKRMVIDLSASGPTQAPAAHRDEWLEYAQVVGRGGG
jgi:radical SAM superfamily enzyme YgiQ (UPF0313 family)